MGIIRKAGINYTAPGAGGGGGGGTPVELIDNLSMDELVDEGTYDPNKIYLVYNSDTEMVQSIFQDGFYYGIGRSGGAVNYQMQLSQWIETVGSSDPYEWDVSDVDLGWYFLYKWDGYRDSLRYIVHVMDDEGSHVIEQPPIQIKTPSDAQITTLMTQAQYDAIIGEGSFPTGFAYCTDSRNLYYEDQVIVENTPPTP